MRLDEFRLKVFSGQEDPPQGHIDQFNGNLLALMRHLLVAGGATVLTRGCTEAQLIFFWVLLIEQGKAEVEALEESL